MPCIICVDIMKGKFSNAYKVQEEIEIHKSYSAISADHEKEIINEYIKFLNDKKSSGFNPFRTFSSSCECGASHTSFPNKHLKFCPKHKEA